MSWDDSTPDGEGNCFEIAANYVLEHPEATLCHGQPTGQGPIAGVRHDHAWIEIASPVGLSLVTDLSNGKAIEGMPAPLYYLAGQIRPDDVRRYSREEARKLLLKHKHYGPWNG